MNVVSNASPLIALILQTHRRAEGLARFSLGYTVSIDHRQATTEVDWYEPVY